jgi:hypothetical protein
MFHLSENLRKLRKLSTIIVRRADSDVGSWDCFLCYAWQGLDGARLLVTVNYAPNQSQCHVRLPFADLGSSRWRLKDLLGDATYDWQRFKRARFISR